MSVKTVVKFLSWTVVLVVFALLAVIPLEGATRAQTGDDPTAGAIIDPDSYRRLMEDSGGNAQVSVARATGAASFVRLPANQPNGAALSLAGQTPEAKAADFFDRYGGIFGIRNPAAELRLQDKQVDALGFTRLTYQQMLGDIPVFAGIVHAHFSANLQLTAVNGVFIPKVSLDTHPALTGLQAGQSARMIVERQKGDALAAPLVAQPARLFVYREGLLRGDPTGGLRLVYEVTVANGAGVREFVYIDAHSGALVEQFTGVYEDDNNPPEPNMPAALIREARDQNFTRAYPSVGDGVLCWNESGQQGAYNSGCELAHEYAYDVYHTYLNGFNRNSLDNAGMTLYAAVDMCPPLSTGYPCPWGNAYWDGSLMAYGNTGGLSLAELDDVVGHEMSHAVTEFTSGLIYAWQSGAINEAFSDVIGESIDILNGRGLGDGSIGTLRTSCSNSTRWKMGENFFVIRDMWDPTCEGGDPDKVTASGYVCSTSDNGGVHTNSGVVNHAYAMLVDGKTFNGQTVAGIGLTKAMHIYYRANNVYLTPTSDFAVLADALDQSCTDLVGVNLQDPDPNTGGGPSGQVISTADCQEVAKASLAVEFRTEPTQCNFEPLLDPSKQACQVFGGTTAPIDFLFEDFEGVTPPNLPTGWTASRRNTAVTFEPRDWESKGALPGSRTGQAMYAPDPILGDCAGDNEDGVLQLTSPAVSIPAGSANYFLSFDHYISAEQGYDGGNLKISVNGGAYSLIPAGAFEFNAYNGILSGSPMSGQAAYTGADGGKVSGSWGTSSVDLSSLASPGDSVRVRWEFATDECNGWDGWYVDNVRIHECGECGNVTLDSGETCDDGNPASGDGCSSTCQVELGWETCTAPVPASQRFSDSSFEAGAFSVNWTEVAPFKAGSPICSLARCGSDRASDGSWYVWYGGLKNKDETAWVEQSVTIGVGDQLSFDLWAAVCYDAVDYFRVKVDGNTIFNIQPGNPLCGAADYSRQSADISPYDDGGAHILRFEGRSNGGSKSWSNIWLDNLYLGSDAKPSVCSLYTADYSDSASSYSLAWHTGGGALRLGSLWTADSSFAVDDDNSSDDGISLDPSSNWQEGSTVYLYADVTGGSGYLAGWFDWNDDGDFNDAQEKNITQSVSAGSNTINFTIPTGVGYGVADPVTARFRLYASEPSFAPSGTETPSGAASSGEVEDYPLDPDAPTAIDLESFDAILRRDVGLISWQTVLEINNFGFNIYRAEAPDGAALKVNDAPILSQVLGSPFGAAYTFLDTSASFGETYYYWLESVSLDGGKTRHGPVLAIPAGFDLFLPLIR